jgi:hypothetical protein
MGRAHFTTSQRYVHWARGPAVSATHELPVEVT